MMLRDRAPLCWLTTALLLAAVPAAAQSSPGGNGQVGQSGPQTLTPPPEAGGSRPGAGGVIQPPTQVDPGIRQAAPPTQSFPTPIVPPPGTPGGNPNVIAK